MRHFLPERFLVVPVRTAWKCVILALGVIAVAALFWHSPVTASSTPAITYKFETVNFPGANSTFPLAINQSGDIVGDYFIGQSVVQHGFLKTSKGYVTIDFPPSVNAANTKLTGINSEGDIVGNGSQGGFLYDQGRFTTIRVPRDAGFTLLNGINATDEMVGTTTDFAGIGGFLYSRGGFSQVAFPGIFNTTPVAINDSGTIVGIIECDGGGCGEGFLFKGGTYTKIDVPGAVESFAQGINNHGHVSGWYSKSDQSVHGFVLINGNFITLDVAGTNGTTTATGINDADQVVGTYTGGNCRGQCGFIATPVTSSEVKVSNVIEGGVGGVSAARCGSTVVVGFADAEPTRPNSFAGVAVSKNGGLSFSDLGTLPVPPVDPEFGPFILGSNSDDGASNPSVACANSEVVHYASVYSLPGDNCSNGGGQCTAISISTSTNGGTTWGLPVVASNLQGSDVFNFVSPSLAVDPTNLMRLYLAYIEYDGDGFFGPPNCFGPVYSLVVVHSRDGGKTWTPPLRVDRACPSSGAAPELTGTLVSPNIAVSPGGKVYVAYEFFSTLASFGGPSAPNEIRFMRSLDGGTTFSTPMKVSTEAMNNAAPQLAVDRTLSKQRGAIYLTWSGAPTGTYTDVLVSDSVNFGVSFSFPRPISPAPRTGTGRFQTNPALAVDNDGQIEACFYDTPSDEPTSSSVYSYNCATSFTHAATWAVHRLASSAPVGFDAVTGDFLLHNDGFFTAFELQTSTGQRHVVGLKSDNP